LFSIYSACGGFSAMTRCLNKAYGQTDQRGFIHRFALCLLMMVIFALSIITMVITLVFPGNLLTLLSEIFPIPASIETLLFWIGTVASLFVLILTVMLIYGIAHAKKTAFAGLLPGAAVTVLLWSASSYGFSFFINKFSRMSAIYGSIAGVFMLTIWLNLVSLFLLIGNEVNSLRNNDVSVFSE